MKKIRYICLQYLLNIGLLLAELDTESGRSSNLNQEASDQRDVSLLDSAMPGHRRAERESLASQLALVPGMFSC